MKIALSISSSLAESWRWKLLSKSMLKRECEMRIWKNFAGKRNREIGLE